MKHIAPFLLLVTLLGSSCKAVHNIFGDKTPHDKYADKLDKHLDDTPEGREWLAVSKRALDDAQAVQLPYRQNGYFQSTKPHSLGLEFKASFGERIMFNLSKKTNSHFAIFADIFKHDEKPKQLFSADTSSNEFSFDVNESGTYILRLQPPLYESGEYSLSVSVGPSLGFPLPDGKGNIGSFWGDNRDGGKRLHEGIDIFAPRLTPVIATADGVITGVKDGGLGGKQVWLRINDKNTSIYYAHLDKQLVQEGEAVKKGEVLGLVGNTGNAKNTPSHLHFGIYTAGGAVDPLPFVNRVVKTAAPVPDRNLSGSLKMLKAQKTSDGFIIKANTELVPLAVNAKGYLAELEDGTVVQMPFTAAKLSPQPVRQPVHSTNSMAAMK